MVGMSPPPPSRVAVTRGRVDWRLRSGGMEVCRRVQGPKVFILHILYHVTK